MAQLKKIGMAAGTFSVALGIGFVMQNGDVLASRFGAEDTEATAPFVQDTAPVEVVQASLTGDLDVTTTQDVLADSGPEAAGASPELTIPAPIVEAVVALPESVQIQDAPEAPIQLASIDPEVMPEIENPAAIDPAVVSNAAVVDTVEIDCVPTMMAVAGPAATVDVALSAPCHTDTAFTVHHQGMMFSAVTNTNGTSKLTVPALAEMAVLIAAFDNGDGAVATVTVPEFLNYDRAVLQWQGDTAVMLSAYENGAEFATENHIFIENPGDITRVEAGVGGYLISLGAAEVENAFMAEIYTYPTGMMTSGGSVTLVAEAEITSDNCGSELNAQSIQVDPTGDSSALDLTMVMPDCDAVGDFLILQNMFQDLTLAAR